MVARVRGNETKLNVKPKLVEKNMSINVIDGNTQYQWDTGNLLFIGVLILNWI